MTKELPTPPDDWTRCHFYVERKRRFCRQTIAVAPQNHVGPARYCGNHAHLYNVTSNRKRVPCPIDASHSIYEDTVAKHILVCPKLKRQKTHEQEDFYRYNINTGGCGALDEDAEDKEASVEWAKCLALRILKAYQRVFGPKNVATESLTFDEILKGIPLMDLSDPELEAGLAKSVEFHRIRSGGHRHLVQQASLIGHLRRFGALPGLDASNKTADSRKMAGKMYLMELGAGRGMLGLLAAGAAAASHADMHLVLVERAGTRGKADTVLRNAKGVSPEKLSNYLRLQELQWTRIQCDLAHVHMPTVSANLKHGNQGEDGAQSSTVSTVQDEVNAQTKHEAPVSHGLVVVAKHLCGAGTDLALRSLRHVSPQINACVMATCCHGICTWNEYVGRDHLRRLLQEVDNVPFGKKEFDIMCRWTAGSVAVDWATPKDDETVSTDQGYSQENDADGDVEHSVVEGDDFKDHFSVSSIVQAACLSCGVQGLGRACQRLIDFGRCEHMRRDLFGGGTESELFHYVPMDITPQNAAIVAYKVSEE